LSLSSEKLVSSLCFYLQLVPLHPGGGGGGGGGGGAASTSTTPHFKKATPLDNRAPFSVFSSSPYASPFGGRGNFERSPFASPSKAGGPAAAAASAAERERAEASRVAAAKRVTVGGFYKLNA
jgi:hypothetical protein